jgi:hypothetical protein
MGRLLLLSGDRLLEALVICSDIWKRLKGLYRLLETTYRTI